MKMSDISRFERLEAQLTQLHTEMGGLSKSKPDNLINGFKLRIVNELLGDANELLEQKYRPLVGFIIFDEAELPSNSDVLLVLGQYLEGLEAWRSAHVEFDQADFVWYWSVKGSKRIQAKAPTRSTSVSED